MLLRASQTFGAIEREIERHQKVLEIDRTISKITVTVIFHKRTGEPIKTIWQPQHETSLTEESDLSR